jgi:hypothetical protein
MKLVIDKGTIKSAIEICLRAQYNQYTYLNPLAAAMIKEQLTGFGLSVNKKFGKNTATVSVTYAQALALFQVCEGSPSTDPHRLIVKIHILDPILKSLLEKSVTQHGNN